MSVQSKPIFRSVAVLDGELVPRSSIKMHWDISEAECSPQGDTICAVLLRTLVSWNKGPSEPAVCLQPHPKEKSREEDKSMHLWDFLSAPSPSSSHLQHWQGKLGWMLLCCRGKCLVPVMRKWVMFAICPSIFLVASLPGFPVHQTQQICVPQKSDMSMWGCQGSPNTCPQTAQCMFTVSSERELTDPRKAALQSSSLLPTVGRKTPSTNDSMPPVGWLAGRSVLPSANTPKKTSKQQPAVGIWVKLWLMFWCA